MDSAAAKAHRQDIRDKFGDERAKLILAVETISRRRAKLRHQHDAALHAAVQAAFAGGVPVTPLITATGLSETRLYQIRGPSNREVTS